MPLPETVQRLKEREPTIRLSCYGIQIDLTDRDGGSIRSDLKRAPGDECAADAEFNAAIDAIESIVLAHAIAGIDVTDPAYTEGIDAAAEACANHMQ